MHPPIENSYVIAGSTLAAGEYPGDKPDPGDHGARRKLARFLDAGISVFVDLTQRADGLAPYAQTLHALAAERALDVHHEPLGIPDMGVCAADHMARILDVIDAHLVEGRRVYVHCWGGVGRTGMVVGCWLVRQGHSGEDALREVRAMFNTMSPAKVERHREHGSPQTDAQRDVVRYWQRVEPSRTAHETPRTPRMTQPGPSDIALDRHLGALLGLAVGDALGTTLEFTSPNAFDPISDMVGGGPFALEPGQWTDDTSMALCLAESLAAREGFDALDQMQRYVRWWREGYWSSTGRCFDIGATTSDSLVRFVASGDPFAGKTDDYASGNGSLMRLAPVPMYFAQDPALAVRMAAESSRTTHGGRAAIDACRYFAGLVVSLLAGRPKEEVLGDQYTPVAGLWVEAPLHGEVAAIAGGSFRRKAPPTLRAGSGYVVHTLEAALWAFATTDDFASGALAAVNLGEDADTTGAVYGQIAGAYYGASGIPQQWLEKVARREEIEAVGMKLWRGGGATAI